MPLQTALAAAAICISPVVHDGDTIRCGRERIRLVNIDAPELAGSPKYEGWRAARAWCDQAAGIAARDALAQFLRRGQVMVRRQGTDVYGRTLATVTVNGQDAGAYLMQRRLARLWR